MIGVKIFVVDEIIRATITPVDEMRRVLGDCLMLAIDLGAARQRDYHDQLALELLQRLRELEIDLERLPSDESSARERES
jgi:hypothetical protein